MRCTLTAKALLASSFFALISLVSAADKKVNHTIESTVPLRTHSIYAPYVDQDLQNRWFSFGANAYVNTNKHIRLTRDRVSEMGWLWSRLPITASNLQIDVEFKISGDSSHLYGDGIAMWLATTRAEPGPVFGSVDKFTGLGLFIDTYANGRHTYSFPRVSAMLGDGQTSYDVGKDGASTEAAGCSANLRRTDITTKLRLTYFRGEYLNVKLHYKGWDEWTECFTLWNVTLPRAPYLGFSAMTGDVSDAHDIISVTTNSVILALPSAGANGRHSSSSSSFSWRTLVFLLKVVAFVVICVVALAGYRAYAGRGRGSGAGPLGMDFSGMGTKGGVPYWDSKRF